MKNVCVILLLMSLPLLSMEMNKNEVAALADNGEASRETDYSDDEDCEFDYDSRSHHFYSNKFWCELFKGIGFKLSVIYSKGVAIIVDDLLNIEEKRSLLNYVWQYYFSAEEIDDVLASSANN